MSEVESFTQVAAHSFAISTEAATALSGISASLCIISNVSRTKFLFQKKDSGYPIPEIHGRLAMFGGAPETGEDLIRAVKRELHEELGISSLDKLIGSVVPWRCFVDLPIGVRPGTYSIMISLSTIPDRDFQVLEMEISVEGVVREGQGVCLSRDEVLRLSKIPEHWAFSQNQIVQKFISEFSS